MQCFINSIKATNETTNCLKIVSLNVRRIHHCWDQFLLEFCDVFDLVDVFILTEINVKEEIIHHFQLDDFNLHYFVRKEKGGGGIALYLRNLF